MSHETVLVVDFGAQYAQLIARRVREAQVFCRIVPYYGALAAAKAERPKALIFSGGPASVYADKAPRIEKEIFELGIPILGICYGVQLTAFMLGGQVEKQDHREYGHALIQIVEPNDLLAGVGERTEVWMSHGDALTAPPPGFRILARTQHCPLAAIGDPQRKIYGVQFHPEVTHTPKGRQILRNFLYPVAGCTGDWRMSNFIQTQVRTMRERVGEARVILGLSGGVDSSVAAVLLHQAVGSKLQCIFVDNGLCRKSEARRVEATFKGHFKIPLWTVDASTRFLEALAGVADPEEKRKIIGREFVRVFEAQARKVEGARFLAQGTLYPDVIESVSAHGGPTATIKSHHNVGGLPADLGLELIEPFRELFKDEVRLIGTELGVPEEIVWRQPFPGPGLGVRIVGPVDATRVALLQEADEIVQEEIQAAGLGRHLWQAFAILLPVRSVGVLGDERAYGETICLRAVESKDGMTADWAHLPYEVLGRISSRIVNEVRGINRVVYDISQKPPATIEWE
ncbi:MAG: glutamine-hydrolyzing GMP synthase [Planctomycetota bacterium]|nr:glutamine-hydrolyzing GMP synthase [Planctomycetota bacterium]